MTDQNRSTLAWVYHVLEGVGEPTQEWIAEHGLRCTLEALTDIKTGLDTQIREGREKDATIKALAIRVRELELLLMSAGITVDGEELVN